MPERAEIKGTTIKSRLEYIREKLGSECKAEALAAIQEAFPGEVDGLILPMAWYPLSLDDFLCVFIRRKSARPEREVFEELGRFSAEKHAPFFRGILAAKRTPAEFFAVIPSFHNTYDRGWGKMSCESRTAGEAVITVHSPSESYRSNCVTTLAYLAETCRILTGTPVEAEEISCGVRGARDCVWRFRW